MTEAAPPQLTLDWLEIRKFRNVEPCRLEFGEGHNVILGINGTGKTQLLELIGALSGADLSFLRTELFEVDIHFALGLAGEQVEVRAELRSPKSNGQTLCRATVSRPGGVATWEERSGEFIDADLVAPLAARLQSVSVPRWAAARVRRRVLPRFDEALGYFDSFTRRSEAAPPALAVDGPGGGTVYAPLIEPVVWDGHVLPLPVDDFEITLGPVQMFAEIAEYTHGGAWMRVRSRAASPRGTRTEYWNPEFRFARGATVISHADLSFGEKRLLAFLYYLSVADGVNPVEPLRHPVVADELTNCLHRSWVDACFDKMEGRQTFLATQSPLLLDRIGVDSAKDAQTTFVVCRRIGSIAEPRLSWSQLTDAEAQAVAAGFERGRFQMSEILHFEGIW